MPRRSYKEQAGVDAEITLLRALGLLLLTHVDLMLVINEINDGGPRVAVVHVVAKTWRIDYSQFNFERLLLKFCLYDINLEHVDTLNTTP
jgi:hypothetical protein